MDVFRVVKDNVTARQVAEYYGMKIADDFGLEYKSEKYKPPQKPLKPKKTLEQEFREAQDYCFKGLSDYLHLLKEWKIKYAPKSMDEEWHPLFCEALDNIDQTEYLWDFIVSVIFLICL